MAGIGYTESLVLAIIIVLLVWPFWNIFKKAGLRPWLSLGMVVPGLQLVLLYYLAFSSWPRGR